MSTRKDVSIALIDVRSAENVGAIFRTADAIGATRIYLVGYTPDPIDRFGRARNDIAKTALGAEHTMAWEHVADVSALLRRLREDKYAIVAVEQDDRAVDYKSYVPTGATACLYGNEITGLPSEALDAADAIVSVPMRGGKESLNVSVTAGITLFRLFDR